MSDEVIARPASEYHEDMGAVLWWRFPVAEPPYVGTPNDCGHPVQMVATGKTSDAMYVGGWRDDYYTHFTPIQTPSMPCAICDSRHNAYGSTHSLCSTHQKELDDFHADKAAKKQGPP